MYACVTIAKIKAVAKRILSGLGIGNPYQVSPQGIDPERLRQALDLQPPRPYRITKQPPASH